MLVVVVVGVLGLQMLQTEVAVSDDAHVTACAPALRSLAAAQVRIDNPGSSPQTYDIVIGFFDAEQEAGRSEAILVVPAHSASTTLIESEAPVTTEGFTCRLLKATLV